MQNMRLVFMVRILAAVFVTVQFASCYTPVEGCLDPESTNYSILGDNDCEDCCDYPDFMLSIFHENNDTTFNLTDTITNDLGQKVSLIDFVFLLSDFEISLGDEVAEPIDLISLNVSDGVESVKDDVIRVRRSEFTYDVGTIIFDGNTDEMSFKVGLNTLLNENEFTTAVSGHPLTNDLDSLFQSESDTYLFQRLKVAQGLDFLDTVIYDIPTAVEVSFPLDFKSLRGFDKTIIIEAQYDKWFEGIDFDIATKEDIENAILENTSQVFRQKN